MELPLECNKEQGTRSSECVAELKAKGLRVHWRTQTGRGTYSTALGDSEHIISLFQLAIYFQVQCKVQCKKKKKNFILCLVLATLKTDSSLCTPSTMKMFLLLLSSKYKTLEAGSCVLSSTYPLEIQYEILYFLFENMISLRGRSSI